MKEEHSKIFVGGLSWSTTSDKLKSYFSKYGRIVDCSVIYDKVTENSKGFGFVRFEESESVDAVLKARPHILDEKQIDPKPCTTKEVQREKQKAEMDLIARYKVFVGGLAQTTTEDDVKQYFETYGRVTDVVFAFNKDDNKNKGFGFVTFEKESAASEAVQVHFHNIGGRRVEVKRAQPRENMRGNNSANNFNNNQGMPNQSPYPSGPWGPMPWAPPYGMEGGMIGPSGGFMPDPTYSGYYDSYYPQATSYYGYNTPYGYYPDMGSYPQQVPAQQQPNSNSSSKSKSSSSTSDSRSYHPYKK